MMQLKYLKEEAVNKLIENIGENLHRYREGNFSDLLDNSDLLTLHGVMIDEDALSNIICSSDPSTDIQNSNIVFNSIHGLNPYLARDRRIWSYLTHTLGLGYSRARWLIPEDDEDAINFILNHMFAIGNRGFMRMNALSRLWWTAYVASKGKYTTLDEGIATLLTKQDVRGMVIERPNISTNNHVLSSILNVLNDLYQNEDESPVERAMVRESMKKINFVGGAKLIQAMSEDEVSKIVSNSFKG